ncbi:MAG TPA: M56 family metallopeptidase [Candidatus Angelobacter sp.]|jgi:beta-lactamase regulating signal transducer with metallopeptidase domain|nr:M56 family metallopeptidase [Candidatus Angelobacter sp.]
MFYTLCVALCLAVLFIVMTSAGMVCSVCFRLLKPMLRLLPPRLAAKLLFTIRALPLLLAVLVTFGLVLPAFLKFEPRSTGELMGSPLLGLAILGAFVLLVIVARGVRLISATRQLQKQWQAVATRLRIPDIKVPVYQVERAITLLAVSGMFRPKIYVSRQVAATLTSAELSAALIHETAHVTSFDNLKQFVLRITRLSSKADVEWMNASEIAADEAALAGGASVLDLSSALIKVGRLGRSVSQQDAIVACHLLPEAAGSMEMRVTHLQKLLEGNCQPPRASEHKYVGLYSFLLLLIAYAACVNAILPWIHEALEFLVR